VAGGADTRRAARALVEAGRRLQRAGLVAAVEGNLSVRTGADRMLITPAGARKGELRVRDLVTVRFTGPAWELLRAAPGRRPSSELGLHLALYARPDTGAVVHLHPPHATAFAAAGRTLDPPALAEQALLLGAVPLLGFAPPGTPAVAALLDDLPPGSRAFLLAGHGAVTVGRDLEEAVLRMETLEACARITLLARRLDPEAALTDQARAALRGAGGPSGH
jgi:L-fuculose-phosphate aldolase